MSSSFDNPPVVERVIGIQFKELPFFTNAHAGWFWKDYLDPSWSQITTAPPIQDRVELFGDTKPRRAPSGFRVQHGPPPERSQIVRASDGRMIQLQNTRFLLNWRKGPEESYLDFPKMLAEFFQHLEAFRNFVREAGGGELEVNQWEISYVNQIPKGELWKQISDWESLLLGFSLPLGKHGKGKLDTASANWSLTLPNDVGRLHITLQHAIDNLTGDDLIVMELTSRGPAVDQASFEVGIGVGHDSIVETFDDITSEEAHQLWGRK